MAKELHQNAEPETINPTREEDKLVLKPSELNIVWGDNRNYWRIPSTQSNGNVEEVAELLGVWWFEVSGSVMLKPSICYQITFKLSFEEDAKGWSEAPIFLKARVGGKGRYLWKRLKELENELELPRIPTEIPSNDDPFVIGPLPEDLPDKRLEIALYEIWSGRWKSGLNLHELIVKEKI
ncbi:hypothetical protein PTKIN_Ptkin08bG0189500 [Pterospermum kingtungense]